MCPVPEICRVESHENLHKVNEDVLNLRLHVRAQRNS